MTSTYSSGIRLKSTEPELMERGEQRMSSWMSVADSLLRPNEHAMA